MVDVAKVGMFGDYIGTFVWDDSYRVARFEYDNDFIGKGIEPSPQHLTPKHMHKRSFLLLLTAIFAIVAGCSRLDTESLILGTWQNYNEDSQLSSDTDLVITFSQDGSAAFQVFNLLSGEMTEYTERYSIDKKNLTIGNESYTIVSITEDKMTWKKVGEGDAYSHFRKK